MMQTGAFLQLILTLTALVARLDCLTADIEENLQDFRLKSLELSRVLSVCFSTLSRRIGTTNLLTIAR